MCDDYLIFLLDPVYNPNHAAPAPTTIEIKPDCSIVGLPKSMYHITHLYKSTMYTVKNNLGNIGENKLLLITSIKIMDEYFETKKKYIQTNKK